MKKGNSTQTGKILTLVLFAVLAVCMILVLMTGAGVYKRLTARGKQSYETRTAPLYIATKVRQADCVGGVTTEHSNGTDILRLNEWIDGSCYVTRIYCYEGYVRELFAAETVPFDPTAGERIAPAQKVSFSLEEGNLSIVVRQVNGTVSEQRLTLRSVIGEATHEK